MGTGNRSRPPSRRDTSRPLRMTSLTGPVFTMRDAMGWLRARFQRSATSPGPAFFFQAEGHLVDRTRSAKHSNRNAAVVVLPLGIGYIVKEECFSLIVRQSLILPPDQRHQLCILLDSGADPVKIPGLLQKRNEVPEIAEVGFWLWL